MPPRKICPEGDGWRWCPDCGRCKPESEFSPSASYCREHQSARTVAAKRRALADSQGAARQQKRQADKRYRERHPEKVQAVINDWKRRNRPKVAAWYADWAARNPEKRRASIDRYRARRALRPARPAAPQLPPDVARELEQQERETRRDS